MRRSFYFVLIVAALACVPAHAAEELPAGLPSAHQLLSHLRPGHPRLLVTDADLARVRQAISTDPLAGKLHESLHSQAVKMLRDPLVEYKLIGPRLLDQSRRALGIISTLAGMYRLDGEQRFADRAREQMLAIAAFKDWHPAHFLDTAEMTNAMAIGYDWLYKALSEQDRATIRNAIIEKGLKEGLAAYGGKYGWPRTKHNWNQVCNGGITAGALALADEQPQLAEPILQSSRQTIVGAMAAFAPDGGCPEGPGYWNYATVYTAYYMANLQSALGTDWGMIASPGFDQTGVFRMQSVGPFGKTFNYADAHDDAGKSWQMLYFARIYKQPALAAWERDILGRSASIMHLLMYEPVAGKSWQTNLPLDAFYKGVNVAFLRSAWADPNALYVGFKGGDNKANHSHLDLGTFVLDALGERWALDLGSDDYNIPGYFGKQRFTYYRLKTEGHNTLTIDDANQQADARAPIVAFGSSAARSFAVADLTAAYKKQLTGWHRGVAMIQKKRVLVQDEVDAARPVQIAWNFHTGAKVEVAGDGRSAKLASGSASIVARIVSPAGATFRAQNVTADPPQRPITGVTKLTIRLGEKAAQSTIAVMFSAADDSAPVTLQKLAQWGK